MEPLSTKIKTKYLADLNEIAQLLNNLATPTRLQIIHFLTQGPLTVESLANKTQQSVANTSMHLRKMLAEGLLQVESLGRQRLYSIRHPHFLNLWEQIQDFALHRNPSIGTFEAGLDYREGLKSLKNALRKKTALLLDTRPEDERRQELSLNNEFFRTLDSALSEEDLKKLPQDKTLLVLCRGRLCGLSAKVTLSLRNKGFESYRLPFSFHQLKAFMLKGEL